MPNAIADAEFFLEIELIENDSAPTPALLELIPLGGNVDLRVGTPIDLGESPASLREESEYANEYLYSWRWGAVPVDRL